MKKENAVTLVALVITIIIMLILATLSIQALTNTGLFESANKAKLETKRGQISETLGLKTMLEQSNNPGGTAEEIITATRNNVIQNKNELEKIGKDVNIEDISTEEDGEKVDVYFYVVVDKDVYKVDMSGSKFIGELGKLLPTIKIKNLTNKTNSITIEVKTSRNEGGKVEYYIKGEDEDKYELKETKTDDSEYTYGDLIQGKKYNIKVIAKAENGQTAEVTAEQTTGSIANLTAGDIVFTYTVDGKVIDKNTWTNGTVNVSAKINPKIDIAGLKIQTSKDGKKYENADAQTFTENGTMYVVLTDGKNYGGSAGGTVTNIDKTRPIITEATATTNSISIKATDEESGIAGYAVTKTSEQPKSEEFTSVDSTKEFSITINNQIQGTTYYAWVKDKAENINEVKTVKTENVTDLIKDVNLTFSYSTTGWTNGDVTVTANTTVSGYTLQTSTDGQDWANAATRTYSNNGMIYARLTDGINYGGVAAGSITNIDKTAPTHTNWWWGEVNASVVRLYIQATDNESGIARVTAPTSTQSGGYSNWVWFDAAWDAGANAYRADITPATFGHYGQTYLTHLYIWDNAGNGGYYNAANVNVPNNINYGTSIQSNYGTLYTTDYPNTAIPVTHGDDNISIGNTNRLFSIFTRSREIIASNYRLQYDNYPLAYVNSGNNTNNFSSAAQNQWVSLWFRANGFTMNVYISNLNLKFANGTTYTVREAFNQGYIEPLVLYESGQTAGRSYLWQGISNIIEGGSTQSASFPGAVVMFKVKNVSALTGVSFDTNIGWNSTYDGFGAFKYPVGFEISTQPIQ